MKRYRVQIVVATIVLIAGLTSFILFAPGVHVTVRNTGQELLRNVTVHVTGSAYSLGDLAPGGYRTRKVSPTSESRVEVEFTDEHGKRLRLNADVYFEPGYRGQVDIQIRDGKIDSVKNEVRISIY